MVILYNVLVHFCTHFKLNGIAIDKFPSGNYKDKYWVRIELCGRWGIINQKNSHSAKFYLLALLEVNFADDIEK